MPNWFKFTYRLNTWKDPVSGKVYQIYRPTVPISIAYKSNTSWAFQALTDSGADRNLFPAGFGRFVGLNIESGNKSEVTGIGNSKITVYTHKVKLNIANYTFDTEIDFSKAQQFPLLGREGFFDHFKKVEFKEKEKTIEFRIQINPKKRHGLS